MEEIVSSDPLEKEILEDARKKGERLLKDADAEQARIRAEYAERTRKALESVTADFASRADRHRNENLARLPLEKGRMKASYVDRLLQAAVARYLKELSPEATARLVSGLLGRAAPLLSGSEVELRCKGLASEAASELFSRAVPGARVLSVAVDEGLPAPGLVARARGGALSVKATLDLVGERLLDLNRGELATALCAEALAL